MALCLVAMFASIADARRLLTTTRQGSGREVLPAALLSRTLLSAEATADGRKVVLRFEDGPPIELGPSTDDGDSPFASALASDESFEDAPVRSIEDADTLTALFLRHGFKHVADASLASGHFLKLELENRHGQRKPLYLVSPHSTIFPRHLRALATPLSLQLTSRLAIAHAYPVLRRGPR